jgi:hypothetical protein
MGTHSNTAGKRLSRLAQCFMGQTGEEKGTGIGCRFRVLAGWKYWYFCLFYGTYGGVVIVNAWGVCAVVIAGCHYHGQRLGEHIKS